MRQVIIDAKTGRTTVQGEETITADMVKAEAQRRILAFMPAWQQRNSLARLALLAGKAVLTPAEATEWREIEDAWDHIVALRAASDVIEALDPIPADYADGKRWPERGA